MTWLGSGSRAGSHWREEGSRGSTQTGKNKWHEQDVATGEEGRDTDRYVGVLVEDDLEEVRGEDRRGFEMLLRSEDVLLLAVGTRRGAGQICNTQSQPHH